MDNRFFDQPILNSPYEYPQQHWELDDQGQPTQQIIESRRRAEFTEVYQIEADFQVKLEAHFDRLINRPPSHSPLNRGEDHEIEGSRP